MSFWDRLTGRQKALVETPAEPTTALPTSKAEARVFELAQRTIRPGFLDLDEVLEQVQDHCEQEPDSPNQETVARLVRAAWQQRLAEQRSWPDQGDYGRLAAAFAELDQAGVTARMNFTCCQNCGHTEIKDERGPDQYSYVFFHQQDSERLADPDATLYLAYSYFGEHPDYDRALMVAANEGDDPEVMARAVALDNRLETGVGAHVVEVLTRHGLDVEWAGNSESRLTVAVREWRKPLIL
jgi:hypothetical protein